MATPDGSVAWPELVFEVLGPGAPSMDVVAHVPHSSTRIPEPLRQGILLDDAELGREVVRLTDWHTDDLFGFLPERGARLIVYRISRLVLDPERFVEDSREPMARVGQGVVYTRSTQGGPLREADAAWRKEAITRLYQPYHEALALLVRGTLDRFGSCTIVDGHSFASEPLPSEPDQSPGRPDICIGTTRGNTPAWLAEALERAFAGEGFSVQRDAPFSGAMVPRGLEGDRRVRSVMIEVRRGLYCDERTGERSPDYEGVRRAIERAVVSGLGLDASMA